MRLTHIKGQVGIGKTFLAHSIKNEEEKENKEIVVFDHFESELNDNLFKENLFNQINKALNNKKSVIIVSQIDIPELNPTRIINMTK